MVTDEAPSDIDDVLARVAAGELTPSQALDLLGPADPDDDPPSGRAATGGRAPRAGLPLRRLVLKTSARSISISTDPSVAEVAISGDHELHRVGDSLMIENPSPLDDQPGRYSLASSLVRAIPQLGSTLEVRMHPDLLLEAHLNAAALKLRGSPAGLRMRLLASAIKIENFVGSVDIDATSSSIKGALTLVGQNRIDCESSSCKLFLTEQSDVTIRAQNQMGKLVLPTSRSKGSITGAELTETVIGRGRGVLAIDATMSSVVIGTTP